MKPRCFVVVSTLAHGNNEWCRRAASAGGVPANEGGRGPQRSGSHTPNEGVIERTDRTSFGTDPVVNEIAYAKGAEVMHMGL
jgi:hypothetical protein